MSLKQQGKADIVDVAKAAKTSISTVSRSFNHPELVKPATRKRIDKAVQKLGYIRNRTAQVMHGRRSGTVGLVVPTIDHAIFAEVIQSFSDALDAAGFTILMATHGFDLDREYSVLRKLLEHRVDGIAVIGLDHSEATFQLIDQQQIPTIAIWNYEADGRLSCVGVNNHAAGDLAAQHLLDLGHRDIGVVFPMTQENDRARRRLQGAMDALTAAGVVVPNGWKGRASYKIQEAKEVCLDILSRSDRPTALLCGNDIIAQGALFAALRLGLKVPADLSIMGIGDFKGSAEIEPPLSTVRIPAKNIGGLAGQRIVAAILEDDGGPLHQECELTLMPRETTAALVV